MIRHFACGETKALFERRFVQKIPSDIQRSALRKLKMIDAATRLEDLKVPPGNRLERLSGERQGQHCIRINDQWRICFCFGNGEVRDVEIVDYH